MGKKTDIKGDLYMVALGIVILALMWMGMAMTMDYECPECNFVPCEADTVTQYETIIIKPLAHVVTATKYNPTIEQCDSTPFKTADGSFIDSVQLKANAIRWCALSQDLLWFNGGPFHYGDVIWVYAQNDAIAGLWTVHDAMNARLSNRIDLLQWFDSPIHGKHENVVISKTKLYGHKDD